MATFFGARLEKDSVEDVFTVRIDGAGGFDESSGRNSTTHFPTSSED